MECTKHLGLGIAALMLGIAPALMADPADDTPAAAPPPAAVQPETPPCPMTPMAQGPRHRQFGPRDQQGPQDGQFRSPMGRMGRMMPMGQMGQMMPMARMARFGAAMQQPGEGNCPMGRMGQFGMMMQRRAEGNCPMMGGRDGERGFGGRNGRGAHHRDNGLTPKAPMSEDDLAKFADLNAKLRDAVVDFRDDGTDQNRDAVKAALEKLVAANQTFEIDRCEKALARAKAKTAEKDEIVNRVLKRLTAEPKCDAKGGPEFGPKGCPKGGPDGAPKGDDKE